ncbi:9185_t:CDS:2 [Scutellospora calospora]|uniref:9185_t:CDS:1 n=1 Tax=Scutellospora calospora TaxID=85575 RepID=A0ACA9KK10_9GLOM|nr:9185_t:CDS:2 [Scutellospora calospora]
MQALNYSVIPSTSAEKFDISAKEFDTYEEINQVISIRRPDMYRASIHKNIKQNQEYAHSFDLETRSKSRQITKTNTENKYVKENLSQNQANNDTNNKNCIDYHCENCYEIRYYSSTYQFSKNHFR